MEKNTQSSNSIKSKLGLVTGIIVFLTVAILSMFFIINSRKSAIKSTKNQISLMAQNSSLNISKKVDETMLKMQDLADYSLMMRQLQVNKREILTEFLKNELSKNIFLNGITLTYEPGKFDKLDTLYANKPGYYTDGRLNIYWYRDENEITYYTDVVNFDEELQSAGGEWWLVPKETKKSYMAVTLYKISGKDVLMLSMALPILENGDYSGVVCFDYQSGFMQQEAINIKDELFEGRSVVTIITDNGLFAANSEQDTLINKNISDIYPEKAKIILNELANKSNDFRTENDTLYLSVPIQFSKYDKAWLINIAIPYSAIMSEFNSQLLVQMLVGLILIILSVIMIMIFIGKLIQPLIDLTAATKLLATGNLHIQVESKQNDEIGILASSFRIMIDKIREIIHGINTGAIQISTGSQQVSDSAQTISQGANEQAAATEQVASSIEEVITAINQNSENAQIARTISKKAENGIIESQQASQKTIDAMRKISEKTSLITQIAQKTNILAINAAIEAARAGNLGKGFGIVAAEVRNLAESSHLAAADIVELSEETLKMSEISGQILSGIVPDVQKTTSLVDEIATASLEQNSGIKQISLAIEQLNSVTLQNSATSEELASSSEELVAQAESLQEAVAFFSTVNTIKKETPEIIKFTETKKMPVEPDDIFHKKEEFIKTEVKSVKKGYNINLDSKPDDEFEAF